MNDGRKIKDAKMCIQEIFMHPTSVAFANSSLYRYVNFLCSFGYDVLFNVTEHKVSFQKRKPSDNESIVGIGCDIMQRKKPS